MQLPDRLNRRALKACFDNLTPQTWDYLFDNEKANGLFECRAIRFGNQVCYSSELLRQWLIVKGYYTPVEFQQRKPPRLANSWAQLQA